MDADTQTVSARIKLSNIRGLHARASNKFVACAQQFDSEVTVTSHNEVGAETVIADSVMELLLLGAAFGEDITITATGPDAEAALTALTDLVENKFDEDS